MRPHYACEGAEAQRGEVVCLFTELATEVVLEPCMWLAEPTTLPTVLYWGVRNAMSQGPKKGSTQRGDERKVPQTSLPDQLGNLGRQEDDRWEKMASWPVIQREIEP